MTDTLTDTIRIRGTAHHAPTGGRLAIWHVAKGDTVQQGDKLATVLNIHEGHYLIRAACSGVVRALMAPQGERVPAGAIVAYVEAPAAPQRPQDGPQQPKQAPAPSRPPTQRRGNLELVELELSTPARKPPARERVEHRGLYLLPSQERAIKRLAFTLGDDEQAPLVCNDSELVRCAIDLLLSLPPAAQRATIERYKQQEAAAGVGSGWPRPGRPRRAATGR